MVAYYLGRMQVALLAALLDAAERTSLGLVLLVPGGNLAPDLGRAETVQIAQDLLTKRTSLAVTAYDPDLVAQLCPSGTFSCFVRRIARGDPALAPRHLAVLSVISLDARTQRINAVLVDTDAAMRVLDADHQEDVRSEALEDAVTARAVVAKASATTSTREQVKTFLTKFFLESSKDAFFAAGSWEPYGTLRVYTTRDNTLLELDEKSLGLAPRGLVEIARVLPGKRRVRASIEGTHAHTIEVVVSRGSTSTIATAFPDLATPLADTVHDGMFWGGMAVAVAGAALTVFALTRETKHLEACATPGECGGRFAGFSDLSTQSFGATPKSGGVLLAPLGYSMFAAGAWWTASSALSDSERAPWIELAGGVVLFVASYALSAFAGGAQ